LAAAGLTAASLPAALRASTSGASPSGGKRAKSCIVLFLTGGPPQHSTWDPKPDAPAEVRGEFGPIDTNVSGIRISSLLPKIARHADKLAILRAMSTGDNAHSSSGYYMLTGTPHVPQNVENANPGAPNNWPNLGATVRHLRADGTLPSAVRLPMRIFNTDGSVWPGQDAGFLGRNADPWLFNCEPAAEKFQVQEFTLADGVSGERLGGRRGLRDELSRMFEGPDQAGELRHYDRLTSQALALLGSKESTEAFELGRESDKTRDRYGRTQFGQSALLARRLVEAGVSHVHVNWFRDLKDPANNAAPMWDSHVKESERLKNVLCPAFDAAFSALLEDLAERGLLDSTLVVAMSEFGRSPRINKAAGRDHWGSVFSIAMAGGGVRGGQVIGSSDAMGGQPHDRRTLPSDLIASILHGVGISPEQAIRDQQGRPFPASRGEVIDGLF
jgi:hypothetical protein